MKVKQNIYFFIFVIVLNISKLSMAADIDYQIYEIDYQFDHPWSSVTLPNGDILITEMPGKIKKFRMKSEKIIEIRGVPKVSFRGQGGLSGIILHPDFELNNTLFLSFSFGEKKNNTLRIVSAKLENEELKDIEIIFEAVPYRKTSNHYGARMIFLNDKTLVITSGDGFNYREDAQKLDNHFGKIIRINPDGSIPLDNPYLDSKDALPEIYSFGHRNQQGIAYDSQNDILYSNEHGPRGGDELNLILKRSNYGWPAITYGIDYNGSIISPFTEKEGMEQPLLYWIPSIAPSDMIFYDGEMFPELNKNLLISSLVPGEIRRVIIDNDKIREEIIFNKIKGRIRSIKLSSNGSLVVLTDGPRGKAYIITKKV